MLTIVDYGVGNISAFLNIYKQLNIPAKTAKTASELEGATKIILPGVGHFDYAMKKFIESGMREKVDHLVKVEKKPVIGICVGMQMMANRSDEGDMQGLGWIDAEVHKFSSEKMNVNLPLPHMGWNNIEIIRNTPLLLNLGEIPRYYFLHSYYFDCKDKQDEIAEANYGFPFTCAANHDNVYGVQFHPEKSHHFGIQLLKNFAELC